MNKINFEQPVTTFNFTIFIQNGFVGTDIDNLAIFIRSIVGVDQKVINEKFGEFLNDNVMNSQQQEFVKAIITATYDDATTKDVTEEATFTGYDMSIPGEQTVTVEYEDKTTGAKDIEFYHVTIPANLKKQLLECENIIDVHLWLYLRREDTLINSVNELNELFEV